MLGAHKALAADFDIEGSQDGHTLKVSRLAELLGLERHVVAQGTW